MGVSCDLSGPEGTTGTHRWRGRSGPPRRRPGRARRRSLVQDWPKAASKNARGQPHTVLEPASAKRAESSAPQAVDDDDSLVLALNDMGGDAPPRAAVHGDGQALAEQRRKVRPAVAAAAGRALAQVHRRGPEQLRPALVQRVVDVAAAARGRGRRRRPGAAAADVVRVVPVKRVVGVLELGVRVRGVGLLLVLVLLPVGLVRRCRRLVAGCSPLRALLLAGPLGRLRPSRRPAARARTSVDAGRRQLAGRARAAEERQRRKVVREREGDRERGDLEDLEREQARPGRCRPGPARGERGRGGVLGERRRGRHADGEEGDREGAGRTRGGGSSGRSVLGAARQARRATAFSCVGRRLLPCVASAAHARPPRSDRSQVGSQGAEGEQPSNLSLNPADAFGAAAAAPAIVRVRTPACAQGRLQVTRRRDSMSSTPADGPLLEGFSRRAACATRAGHRGRPSGAARPSGVAPLRVEGEGGTRARPGRSRRHRRAEDSLVGCKAFRASEG